MVIHCVTPLLSALSLVESHTLSATQELENVNNAHQVKTTKTAPRLRKHVIKSVPFILLQAVTMCLENALSVKTPLKQDVLTLMLVNLHANQVLLQMLNTNVTGNMLNHNVLQTKRLP
jgi:hypothetical protein